LRKTACGVLLTLSFSHSVELAASAAHCTQFFPPTGPEKVVKGEQTLIFLW
jgi:hypothetical protein